MIHGRGIQGEKNEKRPEKAKKLEPYLRKELKMCKKDNFTVC